MRFLLLCDANYLKGEVAGFVNNFPRNHEITTMSSDELIEGKPLPGDLQGILVERGTWQKAFSLLRYFGLLGKLEPLPLAVVTRGRKQESLKGRTNCREIYFHAGSGAEEIFSTLDRFLSSPPALHSYPKGSSKV